MKWDETFLVAGLAAPATHPDWLRLGAFQPRSFVAGPGQRAVVWVAGCLRRCPSCMKPDLFDFGAGQDVAVDAIARRILAIPDLEGVTYSGGEPFEQTGPLANLSRRLKPSGLSILVYTGYRLSALEADRHRFGPLLGETDILIDGEYRHELPGPLEWRGSANQRVYQLSSGRAAELRESNTPLVREIQASLDENRLRLSGFPSASIERELAARLAKMGILLAPPSVEENLL